MNVDRQVKKPKLSQPRQTMQQAKGKKINPKFTPKVPRINATIDTGIEFLSGAKLRKLSFELWRTISLSLYVCIAIFFCRNIPTYECHHT